MDIIENERYNPSKTEFKELILTEPVSDLIKPKEKKHGLELLFDFNRIRYEDATQFWVQIGDIEAKLFAKLFRNPAERYDRRLFYTIKVDFCNSKGEIELSEVFLFKSFKQANEVLNYYEYSSNIAVEFYIVDETTSTAVLYKCFDGNNYSRLAHCEPHIYRSEETTIMRSLFDTKAKLYR